MLIDSWAGHQAWWPEDPPQQQPGGSAAGVSAAEAGEIRQVAWGEPCSERLALMVHGYYLDGLTALLAHVPDALRSQIDLYVSAPLQRWSAVSTACAAAALPRCACSAWPTVAGISPRFCCSCCRLCWPRHRSFVKLHTKASPHLSDGEDWGDHLLNSLLEPSLLQGLNQRLQADPELGLLALAGTKVPISLQLQNNGEHLKALQRRTGLPGMTVLGLISPPEACLPAGCLCWSPCGVGAQTRRF